ncbi:plasmid replication protein, CyRepA1 family [Sinorhizobium meliloti]|uniref:plasmid replication protein, CyRepA1 family n=1 Tax=Rhizobium meliloti TaxID=382 RepID=UPI0018657098|nr:plasmid replication protein, CyRepA1 family [Sinorhizobium meliloti]
MSSWTERKLLVSLNKKLVNKNESGNASAYVGFEHKEVTIDELSNYIKAGHAYCAAMTGPRRASNFAGSDLVSIDVDHGMSLSDALEHPIVKEAATLVYTTASHTEEQNRFRVLFVLQETIRNAARFNTVTSILARKLGGDPKAVDPARLFYGNTNALVRRLANGLTSARITELLREAEDEPEWAPVGGFYKTVRSLMRIPSHQLIRTKAGEELPLSNIEERTSVYCPFHDDMHPSAVVYRSRRGKLIRCFACSETFWPDNVDDRYVFDTFEKAALEAARRNDRVIRVGENEWQLSSLSVVSVAHLASQPLREGVTFIKSAKGTGKTQLVSGFVRDASQTARVLFVGHRVTLVRAMCERLELNCYLDDKQYIRQNNRYERFGRYGICLDSLWKLRNPPSYDIVVLDECEQVLSHFASDTMKEKRHKNLNCLIEIMRRAGKIVALDADLSMLSFETILNLAEVSGSRDRHVVINEFRPGNDRQLEVFSSKNQLAGDLVRAVREGKRCYVVSNSKKIIDQLSSSIAARYPSVLSLTVTSDTSDTAEGLAGLFIRDPIAQSQHHQLVLSSPSLSSGVDLSFPGGAQFYDVVYGFFESGITNHFDCDQQVARVRNPGAVKVFVSPRQMFLEHDPSIVKKDLIEAPLFAYLSDADGFNKSLAGNDKLLRLAVGIEARCRASINRLHDNYVEYKRRLGFSIVYVAKSEELATEGKQHIAQGKAGTQQNRIISLLEAPKLSAERLRALIEKQARRTPLTTDEKAQLERARIESFYRRDIFDELIALHDRVKLADKVRMFEALSNGYCDRPHRIGESVTSSFTTRAFFLKEAFAAARVLTNGGFDGQRMISDDELGEFRRFIEQNRSVYESQFQKNIRSDLGTSAILQLRELLKQCHLKTEAAGTRTLSGKKTYLYRLSQSRLDGLNKLKRVRQKKEALWSEIDGPEG